jgi:hypothetical protein
MFAAATDNSGPELNVVWWPIIYGTAWTLSGSSWWPPAAEWLDWWSFRYRDARARRCGVARSSML